MPAIDIYGEFELPEEKAAIEVVEDPIKKILSSYDFLRVITNKFLPSKNTYETLEQTEKSYDEAVTLFQNMEQVKLAPKELENLLKSLKIEAENHDQTGLFLSALQNSTSIDVLVLDKFLNLHAPGWKLKKDKILFAGHKIESDYMGHNSAGIVINAGKTNLLCHLGTSSCFGINIGASVYLANMSVNGGTYLSLKNSTEAFGVDADKNKGTFIESNLRDDVRVGYDKHFISSCLWFKGSEVHEFINKIKQACFMKNLHEFNYEEQIKKLQSFDFKQFENDLKEIARQVKEKHDICLK